MIVETQTVERYKQSFSLFVYRLLDMIRMAPSTELKHVIKNEVIYLYEIICLIMYGNNQKQRVNEMVEWASSLGSDIQMAVFKDMYQYKLKELTMSELEPKNFVFTFSTIWDSIHLMCLIGDDIIINRQSYDVDIIMACIKNLKWVFYNIFIVLFCPVCAKHYLTIDTFPYEFEKVEVALYREKMGDPLHLVDEIARNQSHKNILHKNHLVYHSMLFHNHVNSFRPIQHANAELNNFQRMDWRLYKNLLGIN
ncbi:P33 [Choristoneura occidentalis granulovirus]|uniref:P33 n=1 Tax=Choristoneura occidentalis granulovirus TaxID=364745 RepID=Q1A4M2_9BBAC|nr:P33 [Choristoneura fumiferana granulovirus]ABC61208.1 P33 [Choristoneura fumiferana granulovirus]